MYIVLPLSPHILWLLYILDVTFLSWFYDLSSEDSYQLGIRLVSPPDQNPRCPHEETLGPYLPIAKFSRMSPWNLAEKPLAK